jgi:hypothetical protein
MIATIDTIGSFDSLLDTLDEMKNDQQK